MMDQKPLSYLNMFCKIKQIVIFLCNLSNFNILRNLRSFIILKSISFVFIVNCVMLCCVVSVPVGSVL